MAEMWGGEASGRGSGALRSCAPCDRLPSRLRGLLWRLQSRASPLHGLALAAVAGTCAGQRRALQAAEGPASQRSPASDAAVKHLCAQPAWAKQPGLSLYQCSLDAVRHWAGSAAGPFLAERPSFLSHRRCLSSVPGRDHASSASEPAATSPAAGSDAETSTAVAATEFAVSEAAAAAQSAAAGQSAALADTVAEPAAEVLERCALPSADVVDVGAADAEDWGSMIASAEAVAEASSAPEALQLGARSRAGEAADASPGWTVAEGLPGSGHGRSLAPEPSVGGSPQPPSPQRFAAIAVHNQLADAARAEAAALAARFGLSAGEMYKYSIYPNAYKYSVYRTLAG
jgi:hypothetical protein